MASSLVRQYRTQTAKGPAIIAIMLNPDGLCGSIA
jgi:hypothetical protein